MNLDDFKEPWQQRQRDLDGRVDHVIKKVRSRMSGFDRTIWFRDMREAIAAIFLIVWYSYQLFQPQSWLGKYGFVLGILACTFIVAVMHWARVKGKVARTDLPMEDYCKAELERVDRQIWLLRDVFHWWYIGPFFIALSVQLFAINPGPGGLIMLVTFLVPFSGFLYWLNQVAAETQLMPLRHELVRAIDGDDDHDTTTEDGVILPLEPLKLKRRTVFIAFIALLVSAAVGGYLSDLVDVSDDAPNVSPFTEVRFENQQIIVTYQGEQYQWLELDGIEVEDIEAAAKKRFWGQWQQRVSEDLVDVLWGMGHQPGDAVELRLRDLETNEQRVIEEAPMTEDNRSAVYRNRS